jgi:hypothetical protein
MNTTCSTIPSLRLKRIASLLLGLTIAFASCGEALAATRTWTGAGFNNFWTNSANWGGTAPVAGDALVFPGTGVDLTSLNNTNTFPDKTPFASIAISGTNYVLNGAAIYFTNAVAQAIKADNTGGTNTVNFCVPVRCHGSDAGMQFGDRAAGPQRRR